MLALKEFANFIDLNMANLATTYTQLLAENSVYRVIPAEQRLVSARKVLAATAEALRLQSSEPLVSLFQQDSPEAPRRWVENINPPHPITEVECLGQTLTPVVTNLEAGKALWQLLADVRSTISAAGNQPDPAGLASQISERAQTEEALRLQQTLLKAQSEAAPDGILLVSEKREILSYNRRFVEMWDLPEAVMQSQSSQAAVEAVLDKLEEPDAFVAQTEYLYRHKDKTSRNEIVLKDGRVFDRFTMPITGQGNLYYGRVWYFRDITEQKQTEENLSMALAETQALYETSQAVAAAKTTEEMLAGLLTALNNNGVAEGASSITFSQIEVDQQGRPAWGEIVAWWFRNQQDSPYPIGTRFDLRKMATAQTWIKDPTVPLLISNSRTDARESETFVKETGIQARAILPLSVAGRWVGALSINWAEPHQFVARDKRVFAVLMSQLASAIETQRLFEQTQQRAVQLTTVSQVATQSLSILDPGELLQTVVDLTKTSFKLYHAHIYLLDEAAGKQTDAGTQLILAAGAGQVGKKMVGQGWRIPLAQTDSLVAQAARDKQGVVVNDVHQNPNFLANPLLPHTQAELAVPLVAGETVLGVLDVQADKVNHFTAEDVRIQTTLAAQVAVALQNANLYRDAEAGRQRLAAHSDRLKRLQEITLGLAHELQPGTEAYQAAIAAMANLLNARHSALVLLDEAGNDKQFIHHGISEAQAKLIDALPTANGPLKDRLQDGQSVRLSNVQIGPHPADGPEDQPAMAGLLGIPIIFRQQLLGRIYFASHRSGQFGADDEALAGSFAASLAGTLQSVKLFKQTQTALAETELLYDASGELSGAETYADIIEVLRQYTLVGQEAETISLAYFDHPWNEHNPPEYVNILTQWSKTAATHLDTRYKLSNLSVIGHQFKSNAIFLVEDVARDPHLDGHVKAVFLDRFKARAILFAPLVVAGQWVGYINMTYHKVFSFSDTDTRRLVALAGQAAVAIQSIYRLGESERRAKREQTIREITARMRSATSLEELTRTTAEELGKRLLADHVVLELGVETDSRRPDSGAELSENGT